MHNTRKIETSVNFNGAELLLTAVYFEEQDAWSVNVWPSRSARHALNAAPLYSEETRDVFVTFAGALEVSAVAMIERMERAADIHSISDPQVARDCRQVARDYRTAFNV